MKYDEQKCLILGSTILLEMQHNVNLNFVTMATYCVPDLPSIKGFSSHLKFSMLKMVNGVNLIT